MPWHSVKTEAIVLAGYPTREADRQYRALTPAFGKVEFVGRGAQKGKAKLASHLEPYAIVDLEIIKGRRSTTVISVERKRSFRSITNDLDKRLLVQSSFTLLDRYTFADNDEPELYQELIRWLEFLELVEPPRFTRSTFLLGGLLLRCLTHLGYDVELKNCISCKEAIVPLAYRWHGGKGGLVCIDCVSSNKEDWLSAVRVSEEIIKLLRFAREAPFTDLLRPSLKEDEITAFANLIQDLLFFHVPSRFERPFYSGLLAASHGNIGNI